MAKFRIPGAASTKSENPEQLFYTLSRSDGIQHLWSQQADMLRAYAAEKGAKNIALELPTGAGKTLIGLLIAEYRRQGHGERVAFACPTRQLAAQVHRQAKTYGVPTVLLTGSHKRWNPGDLASYSSARAVAVTTTSTIFNSSPKLENIEALVLDDAHAAEGFIADLFTVRVLREEEPSVFTGLLSLFGDALPDGLIYDLQDQTAGFDGRGCGLVYPSTVRSRSDQVRVTMNGLTGNARFSWSVVSDHLAGCLLYVTSDELALRPLVPPSDTHPAFANIGHRVFMSATLGNAGDLERSTGVRGIKRLPQPEGWQKKSTGRRLVLFPALSLVESDCEDVATRFGANCPRLLVLTTSDKRKAQLEAGWLSRVGKSVLSAENVEDDLSTFTTANNAALVLTNRYDGIDLPGDACRHMVLDGLPDATNLQERFFSERLNARAVLRERVRTRLSQALGRCTRGDGDYATVVVLDGLLSNFFCEKQMQDALHPELHAEIAFGIENSLSLSPDQFLDLIASFRTQDWVEVEQHLIAERERLEVIVDPIATKLQAIVEDELAYTYAAWFGNWEDAWAAAKRVTEALEGGDSLRPYRALWHLLCASAAENAGAQTVEIDDLQRAAVRCAPALRFFLPATKSGLGPVSESSSLTELSGVNAAKQLSELGLKGARFGKVVGEMISGFEQDKHGPFEKALDQLGALLGFEVYPGISKEKAAPDSVWSLAPDLVIAFEAKSEEKPDKPMSTANLREAVGHEHWVRNRLKLKEATQVLVVVVTPRSTRDSSSTPFANRLRYFSLQQMVGLARETQSILEHARRHHAASGDGLADTLARDLASRKLDPAGLLGRFECLGDLAEAT